MKLISFGFLIGIAISMKRISRYLLHFLSDEAIIITSLLIFQDYHFKLFFQADCKLPTNQNLMPSHFFTGCEYIFSSENSTDSEIRHNHKVT